MHECVYGHKTVIAAEIMYVRALSAADPHLEFVGQNGTKYKMSTAHKDPQAFCRLDNNVISLIRYSNDVRLDAAKKVIDAIDMRMLPKCVMKMQLNAMGSNCEEMQKKIEAALTAYSEGLAIIVKVRSFDHGKGIHRSPLKALFLFENKNPNNILDDGSNKSSEPTNSTPAGALVAFFYIDYEDIGKREMATKALRKLIANHPNYFCVGSANKRVEPPNEEEGEGEGEDDWHFITPPRKQMREEDENQRN
ncbi:hypothetical protein niasHT_008057 [Heterodera trifolii]|uniref:Uncharacterized protein n=1 Tax=Heterodera trifolii TaxID=157864 RepID=A0ABD2LZT4_9BILA